MEGLVVIAVKYYFVANFYIICYNALNSVSNTQLYMK